MFVFLQGEKYNHIYVNMENSKLSRESIKEVIKNNKSLKSFISGDSGCLPIDDFGLPIVIFKEKVSASYYFQLPIDQSIDYSGVEIVIKECVKYLGELLEEKRDSEICHNAEKKRILK